MSGEGWALLAVIAFLALAGGWAASSSLLPSGNSGYPQAVILLGQAIATAEGFWVTGSRAQRNNNPGNIGGGNASYGTADLGWQALYNQVQMMFSGASNFYNPGMTIAQIAWVYADGAHDPTGATNWANNVASALGVTPDTTLSTVAQMNA
jgi:hypothetical protein